MNKQEIIIKFKKQIKIENYSEKTIKNYLSAHKIKKVTGKVIINYPDDCKTIKHFSYSSMKKALASIRFL